MQKFDTAANNTFVDNDYNHDHFMLQHDPLDMISQSYLDPTFMPQ